jgi:hypothetical protein
MRKYPLFLSQDDVDTLAQMLYTHQHFLDVARSTDDRPFRMLSELRRQCCERSNAEDPMPHHPYATDESPKTAKRRHR